MGNLALTDVLSKIEQRKAHDRERSKQYYQEHKAHINARNKVYVRQWRKDNAERIRPRVLADRKRYYNRHKAEVSVRHQLYDILHPEVKKAGIKRYKDKAKLEVITHYGAGVAACLRCGYTDMRALTIDHMNGGGSQHRKTINSVNMYTWLRKNGYPDGYQTLCMNCQMIKKMEDNEYGKRYSNC